MLELLYTSQKAVNTTAPGPKKFVYMLSHDAFYHLGVTVERVNRTYRDGTTIDIGSDGTLLDVAPAGLGRALLISQTVNGAIWRIDNGATAFELDQITWQPDLSKPIGAGLSLSIADNGLFLADLTGVTKYYRGNGSNIEVYNPDTGVLLETIMTTFPGSIDEIHFKEGQNIVLFDFNTGDVMFYDLINRVTLLTTCIEPCIVAAYDSKYQTVCSIRATDFLLQTYSDKPAPTHFSSLTFTPGNFERWHTEDIQVQLLGSKNESVPGIDVQWCIETIIQKPNPINTNPVNTLEVNAGGSSIPAEGELIPQFSVTDENGLTKTRYCLPGENFTPGITETISPKVRR